MALQVGRAILGDAEGDGDHVLDLVQIGDVVDEGELLAGVDEAEGGGIAAREDSCMGEAVEAGVGGGEGAVDRIGRRSIPGACKSGLPTWTPAAREASA